MNQPRLPLVTPVRNEAEYFDDTLRSVCGQTLLPAKWIIVDDNSTDGTRNLALEYASRHPFIEIIAQTNHSDRQLGPRVANNFSQALEAAQRINLAYDFLCKLDGDLVFGPQAFASILALFRDNSRLGIAGPRLDLRLPNGREIPERFASYHVPGCFKVYRRTCFEQMGGLFPVYGWDIADEVNARRYGWETRHTDKVRVMHLRLQGSALGIIRGRRTWGWGAYATCSHPLFALLRGLYRMADPPYVVGGLAFLWGYLEARWQGVQRVSDPIFRDHIRKEQVARLLSFNRRLSKRP